MTPLAIDLFCGLGGWAEGLLARIYRRWPTESACLAAWEHMRWPRRVVCPYCQAFKVARHTETGRRSRWQCWACRRSFSVTVGTPMHKSPVDPRRWMLLVWLMTDGQVSSSAAARALGLPQPTTWRMMRRLRADRDRNLTLLDDICWVVGALMAEEKVPGSLLTPPPPGGIPTSS